MRTFISTFLPRAALGVALFPAAAHAGADDHDDARIVVTATRSEQRLSDIGKTIGVINITQIEQRQTVSVADLLRTTPGVTLARNGGPGSFTGIFIRGAQSEQTVALIDGVKLNDPSSPSGGFNFADLLTDSIERIEILRGPQSVLWGSQAIGGVINLITRAPTDQLRLRATAEYGSRDEGHLTGHISGTAGPVALSASAGYLATDGISAFDRAQGGAERDGFRLFGTHGKARVTLNEAVSLDLRALYTSSKVDLDGFPPPSFAFGDTFEYQRQEQIVGYAGVNLSLFDGAVRNRFAISHAVIDRDSYDPARTPRRTLRGRGRNLRYEYQGTADLGRWAAATFGAEHQEETYRLFDTVSGTQRERANSDSAYLDIRAKPMAGLSLGGGIRYENHSGFGDATTLSADLSYSPNAGGTRFKASYGEGFKAPTLFQLYGGFGTPTLVPERATGIDVGIVQRLFDGRIELSATWFTRRVREQIDFDLGTFTYANLARVRARGFELEAVLYPLAGLRIDANYTRSKSVNRERADPNFGNDLARRPRHSLNLSADYGWAFGLSTGVTISHVSASHDDAGNVRRLKGYTLVNLRTTLPVGANVELFGRIENLFAERYQTVFGYGQPGRSVHAGMRLSY